jgi:ABC-2 type transport system permease protein
VSAEATVDGEPSLLRMVAREVGWQVRLLLRNPLAGVLVVALPVLLLPLVHALNPRVTVRLPGTPLPPFKSLVIGIGTQGAAPPGPVAAFDQYLVPVLVAFGVAAGCFANLAIGVTFAREDGTLKRLRGTPLPAWVHLAGRVAASVVLALAVAAATVAVGVVYYGVEVPLHLLPAAILTIALGAAAFCALGLAVTRLLPSGEVAPAAVFGIVLPMAILSSIFNPPQLAPDWMRSVAHSLPLEPFATSLAAAFNPNRAAPGLVLGKLAALAAWGTFGAVAAVVWFRWEPRDERARPWPAVVARAAVGLVAVSLVTVGVIAWRHHNKLGSAHAVDLGPVATFPIGATVPRAIPLGSLRDRPNMVGSFNLSEGAPDLPVLVHRTATTITVVAGRGNANCALVDRASVDSGWLAAVGVQPAAGNFVDPCAGSAYDAAGACVSPTCEPVLRLPVKIRDGHIIVDLDHGFTSGRSNPTAPSDRPIPGMGATSYRTSGSDPTINVGPYSFAVPPIVVLIFDGQEVRLVGSPVAGSDPFELVLETQAPLGGALAGIRAGPGRFGVGVTSSPRPLQWLSLAVGRSDQATGAGYATSIARLGATSWRLHSTTQRSDVTLELATDAPLPPWRSVLIDLTGTATPGQPVHVHLQLTAV